MTFDSKLHDRQSIRLGHYNYAKLGLYFVTICTQNKLVLFGKIIDGVNILKDAGIMVCKQWRELATRFENIILHDFIIMPNHFHGIIEIVKPVKKLTVGVPLVGTPRNDIIAEDNVKEGQPQGLAPTNQKPPTIGDMVGAFKSLSTNEYIQNVKRNQWPAFDKIICQRNFYEHIIRDRDAYLQIKDYIKTNPFHWKEDIYFV